MEWGEGDQWTLTLDLPPGTHHFKLAVTRGGQPADWEGGANRSLEVPAAGAGPGTALLATCEWGSTHVALEAAAAAEQDAGAGGGGGGCGSWAPLLLLLLLLLLRAPAHLRVPDSAPGSVGRP
jgi:hypothetical protein